MKINDDALVGVKEIAAYLRLTEYIIPDLMRTQGMPYRKHNGRYYGDAEVLKLWYRAWCSRPHPNEPFEAET